MSDDKCCVNTDREIYRGPSRAEWGDDDRYYADSIHVTEGGGIGINCGGYVIVKPLRDWHALGHADSARVEHQHDSGRDPCQYCGARPSQQHYPDCNRPRDVAPKMGIPRAVLDHIAEVGVDFAQDGNQVCATFGDHIDLQQSPAGFGENNREALRALVKAWLADSAPEEHHP